MSVTKHPAVSHGRHSTSEGAATLNRVRKQSKVALLEFVAAKVAGSRPMMRASSWLAPDGMGAVTTEHLMRNPRSSAQHTARGVPEHDERLGEPYPRSLTLSLSVNSATSSPSVGIAGARFFPRA